MCLSIHAELNFRNRILKHPDLIPNTPRLVVESQHSKYKVYFRPIGRYGGELILNDTTVVIDNNSSYVFASSLNRRITCASAKSSKASQPWTRFADKFFKIIFPSINVIYYDYADHKGGAAFRRKKFKYPTKTRTEITYNLSNRYFNTQQETQDAVDEILYLRKTISVVGLKSLIFKALYFRSSAKICSDTFRKKLYQLFQKAKYQRSVLLSKYFTTYGRYLGISSVRIPESLQNKLEKLSSETYSNILTMAEIYHGPDCKMDDYPILMNIKLKMQNSVSFIENVNNASAEGSLKIENNLSCESENNSFQTPTPLTDQGPIESEDKSLTHRPAQVISETAEQRQSRWMINKLKHIKALCTQLGISKYGSKARLLGLVNKIYLNDNSKFLSAVLATPEFSASLPIPPNDIGETEDRLPKRQRTSHSTSSNSTGTKLSFVACAICGYKGSSLTSIKFHLSKKHKESQKIVLEICQLMNAIDKYNKVVAFRNEWSQELDAPVLSGVERVPELMKNKGKWITNMSEGASPLDFFKLTLSPKLLSLVVEAINNSKNNRLEDAITERDFVLWIGKYLCYCLVHVPVKTEQHGYNSLYRNEYIAKYPLNNWRFNNILHGIDGTQADVLSMELEFNAASKNHVSLNDTYSYDETLVKSHRPDSNKRIIQRKPAHTGVLAYQTAFCNASMKYCMHLNWELKVKTIKKTKLEAIVDVVKILREKYQPEACASMPEPWMRLVCDSGFGSISLAKNLNKLGVQMLGTVGSGTDQDLFKKWLHNGIEKKEMRIVMKTMEGQHKLIALSYLDHGKKPVNVLASHINKAQAMTMTSTITHKNSIPFVISEYNLNMDGVDQIDKLIGLYKYNHKIYQVSSNHVRMMTMVLLCLINAWSGYRSYNESNIKLKTFYEKLIEQISGNPMRILRRNGLVEHLPEALTSRKNCYFCKQRLATFKCTKCGAAFHLKPSKNCYKKFHDLLNECPKLTYNCNFVAKYKEIFNE